MLPNKELNTGKTTIAQSNRAHVRETFLKDRLIKELSSSFLRFFPFLVLFIFSCGATLFTNSLFVCLFVWLSVSNFRQYEDQFIFLQLAAPHQYYDIHYPWNSHHPRDSQSASHNCCQSYDNHYPFHCPWMVVIASTGTVTILKGRVPKKKYESLDI